MSRPPGPGPALSSPPGASKNATDDVQRRLEASLEGLGADEARARLERYGPNEVERERVQPWWSILLHQFRDPLIYTLWLAALATFLLDELVGTGVILAVVALNALIGFVQEFRAREAMRALARLSAPQAEVVRAGKPLTVDSRELVPGDVVLLTSGSRVPADLRLFSTRALEVDESALTGESVAVEKSVEALEGEARVPGDQTNMAFAATTVTRGRGKGIVVRTGAATELGRIAEAVRAVGRTATPLQEKLDAFSKQIGLVILGLTGLVVVIGLLQGMPLADLFLTAVALAVASIPEGLPIVLTVTLAIGVRRMARRNAIIRSLPAVETLGSTTVIGSDKTGTGSINGSTGDTLG